MSNKFVESEEPKYVAAFRLANGAEMSRRKMERAILRAWDVKGWREDSSMGQYGYTWAYHFKVYLRELYGDSLDWNPWFERCVDAVEETRFVRNRRIVNLIGSQSAGKSEAIARIMNALMTVWPDYSRAFFAAPYKNAAEVTIWSRMKRIARDTAKYVPEWRGVKVTKDVITYQSAVDEAGTVTLFTSDKVGKLQGTKSVDREKLKGFLLVACDEIGEFQNKELLKIIDNISSQDNLLIITGCNFTDTEGLDGDICRPVGGDYEDLDVEADHEWDSAYNSRTYRFDGHRSPNILAGEVKWRYLLTEERRQEMEAEHGKTGPRYMAQIRSFPAGAVNDFAVLSRDRLRAGGAYDEFVEDIGDSKRVAFCDPGFGGDPCRIGAFEFLKARVFDSSGESVTRTIFRPLVPMETIKVEWKKQVDEDWLFRVSSLHSDGKLFYQIGQEITVEDQIALQCGEFCKRNRIPFGNFGFDGSMRARIVQSMILMLGQSVIPVDPVGKATERPSDARGTKAEDMYLNFVTEEYFNFATMVASGQFRGADLVQSGLIQMCRRFWQQKGNRKQVEPKSEYKKSNKGKSPDDADVLAGGLEIALQRGFSIDQVASPKAVGGGGINRALQAIASHAKFRKRTAAKLRS